MAADHGDKTRDGILRATLAEIDAVGLQRATIARIRSRAEVSNGSFFHAFATREALLQALFLTGLETYHKALLAPLKEAPQARPGVAALVSAHVRWVMENRAMARFLFTWSQDGADGGDRSEQARLNARMGADLRRWCEPLMAEGGLYPIGPELLLSQIIGPAQLFCRAWLSGRAQEAPDQRLDDLIACACRAVLTRRDDEAGSA